MDISNYLNDIPTLIMTAIAALGGTATGIGTLLAWISKVVKNLKSGKEAYDEKVSEYEVKAGNLEVTSDRLKETGNTLDSFATTLKRFEDWLKAIADTSTDTEKKYSTLASVLLLIAENTPQLIQNGTADKIKHILYPEQTENTIEEISNESDG